jgi:hypothetical protein
MYTKTDYRRGGLILGPTHKAGPGRRLQKGQYLHGGPVGPDGSPLLEKQAPPSLSDIAGRIEDVRRRLDQLKSQARQR